MYNNRGLREEIIKGGMATWRAIAAAVVVEALRDEKRFDGSFKRQTMEEFLLIDSANLIK